MRHQLCVLKIDTGQIADWPKDGLWIVEPPEPNLT